MAGNRLTARVNLNTAGLKALQRQVPDLAQKAVDATALFIESGAKELSQVDTGRQRASIAATLGMPGTRAQVGVYVDYAIYNEFGSRGRPARPFLFPAAEAERQRFIERLKAVFSGKL